MSRVPMLCECGDLDCRKVVMIRLEDYRAMRRDRDALLTAPGHSADESDGESGLRSA